jgi:hypothetical protein
MNLELSETGLARLILGLVIALVALSWFLKGVYISRRRRRFVEMAERLGAPVERQGKFLSRFSVEAAGRTFEVRDQHISGSTGAGWTPDWYLVTETKLRGVSELHAVEIRPRAQGKASAASGSSALDEIFEIRDSGYPLPEGWLGGEVGRALLAFYAVPLYLEPLRLEESRLLHCSRHLLGKLGADGLRSLLERQAAVAKALERAL